MKLRVEGLYTPLINIKGLLGLSHCSSTKMGFNGASNQIWLHSIHKIHRQLLRLLHLWIELQHCFNDCLISS
jgi:hypothetical protein